MDPAGRRVNGIRFEQHPLVGNCTFISFIHSLCVRVLLLRRATKERGARLTGQKKTPLLITLHVGPTQVVLSSPLTYF
jgi:hypothetical protein